MRLVKRYIYKNTKQHTEQNNPKKIKIKTQTGGERGNRELRGEPRLFVA